MKVIPSSDLEKYRRAQQRELSMAAADLIMTAAAHPKVVWDGISIRQSARSPGIHHAAYGIALLELIETGVMSYDQKTHEVGLIAVGHA